MSDSSEISILPEIGGSNRSLAFLLAAFAAGGCAALIYEVVWFQMLQMVIGSTAVSLAVLLGTYMGGMGLGSLVLPRLVSPRRNPLRVYAWLELGIGAIGLAVLFGMPAIVRVYTANAGHGFGGILLRGAVSALCLLIPTILMGATLPILSRWLETTPRGVARMGFLYAGNTAGAVLGCLLAGFYLLRVHDVSIATYAAAAINLVAAAIGFALALKSDRPAPAAFSPINSKAGLRGTRSALAAIGISGFCALGAEEIWTRLLSLMLGGTVYTFAIILAVFLAGLGLGGVGGASWIRRRRNPGLALSACQFFLVAAIAYAAFMLFKPLPYWVIGGGSDTSPWLRFLTDLVRTFLAVFPPAFFWGASFPLALAAVVPYGQDPGRSVGKVYAANTAGAILGAIGFNLVLIPALGTRHSQQILIAMSALAGILALIPFLREAAKRLEPTSEGAPKSPRRVISAAAGAVAAAVILALLVPRVSWELIAYGRRIPSKIGEGRPLYYGEGLNSSVAVTELDNGIRNFHVSGKVEASSDPTDLRLEGMLGHLPSLIHPDPKSVLIVGFGAGVTAGSFVLYPSIKRIVICEIEPLIPKVVARFFSDQNNNVLDDSRVEIIYDDARHYILTTREKFDIITSDPIHPWIKGSAALYSQEYFEMCRSHLNPAGVITQWVPFYESTPETVKSEIATFFKVFPQGTIWSNDISGAGYDVVLLSAEGPVDIDIDRLQSRLERGDHKSISWSLQEIGFSTAVQLLATYAGRGSELGGWLEGAAINRDRNLRLQYLAGMSLNAWRGGEIFDSLLKFVKFPSDLFSGSDESLAALKKALNFEP